MSKQIQQKEFKLGFQDSLSAGIGIFPLGIGLGLLVMQMGLPWWTALLLPLIVFAGSVEFLLVSLITTGASLATIALTVFAVNFRHVFYAFVFPLEKVKNPFARAYSVFALIDEAVATYSTKDATVLSGKRIVTMQFLSQLYWVSGSMLGVALSNFLPANLQGFEFALCALFTVLTIDAFASKKQIPSLLLAATATAIALIFFPEQKILAAFIIFAFFLLIRFLYAYSALKVLKVGNKEKRTALTVAPAAIDFAADAEAACNKNSPAHTIKPGDS